MLYLSDMQLESIVGGAVDIIDSGGDTIATVPEYYGLIGLGTALPASGGNNSVLDFNVT